MFQFLIGTLKTGHFARKTAPTAGFQFLIGTLKTFEMMEGVEAWEEFQFLIGTLKTRWTETYCCYIVLVSIPHRYAKNCLCIAEIAAVWRFQFLIGTLKTFSFFYSNAGEKPFQFLIGTLKTE